jgi:hypothetical protein
MAMTTSHLSSILKILKSVEVPILFHFTAYLCM